MPEPPRCGNCGRFGGVRYAWRGPHYSETFWCRNCEAAGYRYDPWAAALAAMSDAEVTARAE
jgi:hypothetical protein